jgi:hypothetical protein
MRINVADLRVLCDRMLVHLTEQGIDHVDLTVDYYWDIPEQTRYDPYRKPSEHVLGQLTDDWGELLKVIEGTAEPISYMLVWLAAVLRAVGETVVR